MVDTAKKDKLLSGIASNAVDLDELVDEQYPPKKKRVAQLLAKPSQRDPKLWSRIMGKSGLDPKKWAGVTWKELHEVLIFRRRKLWHLLQKTIWALAHKQAELELTAIPNMEMAERNVKSLTKQSLRMDKSTAQAAAKEGTKQKIKAEKQRRKDGKAKTETNGAGTSIEIT